MTESRYLGLTDKLKLDRSLIHSVLSTCYWCGGIPKEIVNSAIDGSLCFGLYEEDTQIGFARVITDETTFAYLCDVFIVEEHRGQGLSKFLMEEVLKSPKLQGLRRFCLATRNAHGLYEKFGFFNSKGTRTLDGDQGPRSVFTIKGVM